MQVSLDWTHYTSWDDDDWDDCVGGRCNPSCNCPNCQYLKEKRGE